MRIKTILICLLSLIYSQSHAQNENEYRDAYSLKLAVDGKRFYEQNIERTPYFVKEKVLQIYPGEKLFIEAERADNEITSMKVVKKNINPEKTIIVNFTQEVKQRKSEMMMLEIINPFDKDLEYKAIMYIVGQNKWIDTDVLPVNAKLTGIETWADIIISLGLSDWKFKK